MIVRMPPSTTYLAIFSPLSIKPCTISLHLTQIASIAISMMSNRLSTMDCSDGLTGLTSTLNNTVNTFYSDVQDAVSDPFQRDLLGGACARNLSGAYLVPRSLRLKMLSRFYTTICTSTFRALTKAYLFCPLTRWIRNAAYRSSGSRR